MKSYLFAAVIFLSIAYKKCGKPSSVAIPSCVQAKIDAIRAQPKWNPAATVYEYEYEGRRVYGFNSNCCDQFNAVYDESCNYICAASGGFTGKGDGKCSDFAQEAKQLRLVWKDER